MAGKLPEGQFELKIFPLPSLVFFPGTRLPLHIFEERYRAMVADAMASDGLIGMILLQSGWEGDYYGVPPVHRIGTVGFIEHVVRLDDGRYNLLLGGHGRFEIVSERAPSPYRVATVIARPERAPSPVEAWGQRQWLGELARRYIQFLPGEMNVREIETANLESLVNALVMSLNVEAPEKQELLELDDLLARCERVGSLIEKRLETMQFLEPFRRDSDPDLN
ncbi:MAG: LON peptidase substrate-binding domain-containing protein [Thermoanaerobaculia bacterium]